MPCIDLRMHAYVRRTRAHPDPELELEFEALITIVRVHVRESYKLKLLSNLCFMIKLMSGRPRIKAMRSVYCFCDA